MEERARTLGDQDQDQPEALPLPDGHGVPQGPLEDEPQGPGDGPPLNLAQGQSRLPESSQSLPRMTQEEMEDWLRSTNLRRAELEAVRLSRKRKKK